MTGVSCFGIRVGGGAGCSGPPSGVRVGVASGTVYILPAEASFDTEVSSRDVVVQWRGGFDDPVILNVKSNGAPHPAVRADGIGAGLPRFIPCSGLPHFIFTRKHERPRGAHSDAVAAVYTGGLRSGKAA